MQQRRVILASYALSKRPLMLGLPFGLASALICVALLAVYVLDVWIVPLVMIPIVWKLAALLTSFDAWLFEVLTRRVLLPVRLRGS